MYSDKHQNQKVCQNFQVNHGAKLPYIFFEPLSSDEKLFILMNMYRCYLIMKIMKKTSAHSVIKKFNKIFLMFDYSKKWQWAPFQSDLLKSYFEFLNIEHVKSPHLIHKPIGWLRNSWRSYQKTIKTSVYKSRTCKNYLHEVTRHYRSIFHATADYSQT